MFGSYADRLRLRWETVTDVAALNQATDSTLDRAAQEYYRPYKLQIKTSANYGDKYRIRYYITRLWFDSAMEGSRDENVDRDPGAL